MRPHVLVKGGDYKKSEVVGNQIVERAGGRSDLVDLVPSQARPGWSSAPTLQANHGQAAEEVSYLARLRTVSIT